ncbi:MAG: hypothetical protein LBI80_00305 [Endomicrobium sp.]|nr:hypothetical protein [Endomicrobium sp.]
MLKIIQERDEKFSDLEKSGISFYSYSFNCSNKELQDRFEEMTKCRWQVYFSNPEDCGKVGAIGVFKEESYKVPKNWDELNSRFSYPTGLAYNLAHEKYNAGILISDSNNIFLAIEAPSSKNIKYFYEMLSNYEIESIVRLHSDNEYYEDFYPYWRESEKDNLINKIKLSDKYITYYNYDWPHKQSADIRAISNIIEKSFISREGKIMAVSCRAGSGRTGTYICCYLILNEIKNQIDRGIPASEVSLNIDKIVWLMSIQRPFAVTHLSQYKMLYKFADYHISKFKTTTLDKEKNQ